jgi:Protein of unknown function (DUF4235)
VPKRRDVVAEELEELLQDLRDLWVALRVDPKKQARKERAWSLLAGAFGALATMVARRAAAKAWGVLTGEQPPVAHQTKRGSEEPRREEAASVAPTSPP